MSGQVKKEETPLQRAKRLERKRQYRERNKEKLKEYNNRYYLEKTIDKRKILKEQELSDEQKRQEEERKEKENLLLDKYDWYSVKVFHKRILREYGIGIDDYKKMQFEQKGRCWICQVEEKELTKSLHIDHDHKTGEVRGLLCDKCNRGLGFFNDEPVLLERAIDYLKKSRTKRKKNLQFSLDSSDAL